MITLTASATKEVQNIMKTQELEIDKNFLRIGVKGGGCSGYTYTLDITEDKKEEDELFEHDGVTIICDSRSHIYLDGTELDFKNGLQSKGFVFNNPNHTTCGCGSSFS